MNLIEKEAKNVSRLRHRRFTSSARAAFAFLLSQLKHKGAVLLPSYIGLSKIEGSGVFDPVRKSGIGYEFYRVNKGLEPDLNELERKASSGRFSCLFLIHYFGLPQADMVKVLAICQKHNCFLIEDCAHSLIGSFDTPALGDWGDFSIFSIHKSTFTQDGGFFVDRRGLLSNLQLLPEQRISIDTLQDFTNIDLIALSRKRQRNYAYLNTQLPHLDFLEVMYPKVRDNWVPLNFPVIVKRGLRERLYFKLIENGIHPTALYHTLIPEISKEEFPDSIFVANNILNLPTHQDVETPHIDRMLEIITEFGRST